MSRDWLIFKPINKYFAHYFVGYVVILNWIIIASPEKPQFMRFFCIGRKLAQDLHIRKSIRPGARRVKRRLGKI